ncbi:hypothetical protein [Nostoc sp. ChiSLP03a]|uniref:hypothetical protein n=1 Tax=Nostoc sp. ChiSLP03a TaxID=3075380 RepID=UPI002AD32C37|nr:hypothetical protein [Nostoc sp. ChiSLP03a]MDZ8211625.1 hypothetical protein [Nostoc sp. ChiSLP03a]
MINSLTGLTPSDFIPDFADDADSICVPEDWLFPEDEGKYSNCCHCQGRGFLYGDLGWICPECDGTGIGGVY